MNEIESVTISTEPVPCCPLCGEKGAPLYQGLRDHLFGVSGEWNLKRCINPACGLVWLDPRPVEKDIGKLYAEYHTHSTLEPENQKTTALRRALILLATCIGKNENDVKSFVNAVRKVRASVYDPHRKHMKTSLVWLKDQKKGLLLDVGCGSGAFLKEMNDIGWKVIGVETDLKAVEVARKNYSLDVRQGDLHSAEFPENTFDAVTVSHVIEHVIDPVGLLIDCRRVLKPGGRLVVTTPNIASLGHRIFGQDWRGLEPPRHLSIFSDTSLTAAAQLSGLGTYRIKSISRMFPAIWASSKLIRNKRISATTTYWQTTFGIGMPKMFHILEYSMCKFKNIGEELLLIATK